MELQCYQGLEDCMAERQCGRQNEG
jgi:hypothetical protein